MRRRAAMARACGAIRCGRSRPTATPTSPASRPRCAPAPPIASPSSAPRSRAGRRCAEPPTPRVRSRRHSSISRRRWKARCRRPRSTGVRGGTTAETKTRGGTAAVSARGDTAPEASPSPGAAEPGHVTLSPDAVTSSGIETVAVARVTAPAEIDAFGRVLDPLPLVDALHGRGAARSAAAAARAEHERVVRLHHDAENASTRDVENARAALDRADAELANGRAAVARIDLPAGEHVEQMPATITVAAIGRPERPLVARVLGAAPTTDATMQGDAYLVLIAAEPPPAGTALRATVARAGAALAGVAVPRPAIVWFEGRPAAYVERGPGRFE